MATSSRARFRPEIPGWARASFRAARDSGNRPASVRHWASVQCRSTSRSGSAVAARPRLSDPLRLGRVADPVQGLGEAAGQAVVLAASRPAISRPRAAGVPRRPGGPGRPAAAAVRSSQRRIHSSIGSAASAGSADRLEQLPGHPVGRCAGLGQRPAGLAVPGGPDRGRDLLVQGGPDHRVPEPEAAARLGQHAGGPGLVHGRDQVRDTPAEHGGQVGHGKVHAQQGGRAQDLPHPGGDEAEPVRDRGRQGVGRAVAGQLRGSRARPSGWSCGPARPPVR